MNAMFFMYSLDHTSSSSGDEISECDMGSYAPLAFNAPGGGVPLGRSP